MQATLLVGVALAALTAFVYFAVGNRVASRTLTGDDRLANRMFAGWWWSLGTITGVGALINLAAALGYTHLGVHLALTVVLLFVLCASLWALGFYLIYLFTGRRAALYPLGLFYLGYFAFIMNLVWQAHPVGVQVSDWAASIRYESGALADDSSLLYLILLVAPQVIGGIAYFSLFFRVDDRSQRYRISMIAGSIVVWFGSAIAASAAGLNELYVWPVVSRLIALAAAGVVYVAFQPPRWMQRRYRIEPIAVALAPPPGLRGELRSAPRPPRAQGDRSLGHPPHAGLAGVP